MSMFKNAISEAELTSLSQFKKNVHFMSLIVRDLSTTYSGGVMKNDRVSDYAQRVCFGSNDYSRNWLHFTATNQAVTFSSSIRYSDLPVLGLQQESIYRTHTLSGHIPDWLKTSVEIDTSCGNRWNVGFSIEDTTDVSFNIAGTQTSFENKLRFIALVCKANNIHLKTTLVD